MEDALADCTLGKDWSPRTILTSQPGQHQWLMLRISRHPTACKIKIKINGLDTNRSCD